MTLAQKSDYTACLYGAEAERNHDGSGIKNYNESMYVNFFDPVTRVGGMIRVGNRPDLGYKEGLVNILLPGGRFAYRSWREESTSNDDFSSKSLSFTFEEPTRKLSVAFDDSLTPLNNPSRLATRANRRRALKSTPAEPARVDLQFDATSPMFVINADGSGDCTPGDSIIASDHYEQFGGISGTISVGSSTWQLTNVTGFRDHSWGRREWSSYHGEWLSVHFADGTSLTAYSDHDSDGVRHSGGAVVVDDRIHYITDFEVFTDYDGESTNRDRFKAVVKAEGLPLMPLDGTILNFIPVTQATGENQLRMGQMAVEFVGPSGAWGLAEMLRPHGA